MIAHVTPGDFVVPRAVIDANPPVLAAIMKAFGRTSEQYGQPLDWRTHMVGGAMNSHNPISGAPEFMAAPGGVGNHGGIGDSVAGQEGSDSGGIGNDADAQEGTAAATSVAAAQSDAQASENAGQSVAASDSGGLMDQLNNLFSRGRNAFEAPDGKPNVFGHIAQAIAPSPISLVATLADMLGADHSTSNSPQGVDGIEGAIGDALGEGAISRGNAENIRQAVAAYNRPAEATAPVSLGLAGMSPLQQRAAIATGAVASNNPAFRDTTARDYYRNLLQRSFVNDDGSLRDINELLPVEQQYLSALGLSQPSTTQALLQAIAAA